MDLNSIDTGLAILGASQLTKDAVHRVLAPAADYIGAGLLSTTKAAVNLTRVLLIAVSNKVRTVGADSIANPRVLKGILDEAPFCDDEVMAEYLGGILAGSLSGNSRDDRAVALLATIRRLSTYALRTHYVGYIAYATHWFRFDGKVPTYPHGVFIPQDYYEEAMAFTDDKERGDAWAHSIGALERETLASIPWAGSAEYFARLTEADMPVETLERLRDEGGLVFRPTVTGTELFLAGFGYSGYLLKQLPRQVWQEGNLHIETIPPTSDRCTFVEVLP